MFNDNIRNTVLEVLREDPKTRDSDKWLIIQVLRKLGIKVYLDYSQLNDMPSFESITRCRRSIQNQEGLYPPTKEIEEQRGKHQEEYRQQYSRPVGFF